MLDPNNLTDRKLLEEARKQQEKFRADPASTSPRQPAEQLTKDNVLRHWRTCEDGITCMESATGRNREHADWVKFSDFAQVVDERDEAYRSASLPVTPLDAPRVELAIDRVTNEIAINEGNTEIVDSASHAQLESSNQAFIDDLKVLCQAAITPIRYSEAASLPVQQAQPPHYGPRNEPGFWETIWSLHEQWQKVWKADKSKYLEQYPKWIVDASEELFAHDMCDAWDWNEYVSAAAVIIARHFNAAHSPAVQALESQCNCVIEVLPDSTIKREHEPNCGVGQLEAAFRNACMWVWKLTDAPGQTLESTMATMRDEARLEIGPALPVESLSKSKAQEQDLGLKIDVQRS